jgi:hypothetical protein
MNEVSFDGKVLLVQNYLSQEEINGLKEWAILSESSQFVDGISRNLDGEFVRVKNRVTNRMSENINYPEIVYSIQSRMRKDFGLEKAGLILGHGKDGVVVSITHNGGDVHKHRDPNQSFSESCLRLNILVSRPINGGLIHVEDRVYNPEVGDLMGYLVSDYEHWVETCNGNDPRIMFMFGFIVNKSKWESEKYFNNYKVKL